ncbi:rab GTPase-binding effector protein 2 [Mugil cephalus]|uniref:rab GTPase-binding effector protein 2 n=1 Tax=Mugil cephalus TaxID=48193 RepID=UPI001FB7568B|nr:rab GTPase-binding effector protein 2 [Mugil cephalus]
MEPPYEKMSSKNGDTEVSLQAELAECRAQVEHWQGMATICELSKQEEMAELQKQYDQEIQSLQEALRETAAQYEARISVLQSQPVEWRRAGGQNMISGRRGRVEEVSRNESPTHSSLAEDETPMERTSVQPAELEAEAEGAALTTEGYFSLRNCDSASLSSFSMDTPSLPRKRAQEDTDSLVSTGTLVPEAIYLPPPGHRLVTHGDWDALNAQVSDLRGEVSRLQAEKEELEKELDTQTKHTQKQVSMLQSQVQTSESLLQDVQKSFSQSQNAVESQLAELSLFQKKMSTELSRLKGQKTSEEQEEEAQQEEDVPSFTSMLHGAHCEERLRIEIVNLREELDSRKEENEVLEVQFSSLKTETERIQGAKEQREAELLACRREMDALRVALSHVRSTNKTLSAEKAALNQQSLELRSQVISLRSQLDTSQSVQRDFVQLSQSLQVKLELIRQAESLEQVRKILEEEEVEEVVEEGEGGGGVKVSPPADAL